MQIGISLSLTSNKGVGVPSFITINGVLAQLLLGRDGQALQGRDGQYLYGRA